VSYDTIAPVRKREGLTRARGVTLACVDCNNPTLAACALDYSRRSCEFDRVVLFSDEPPDVLPDGVDYVRIPELSFKGYQRFMLRELWRWTHTPHVLTIETDGWILKPERWNPEWLKWDYIGAPWPETLYAKKSRVGNSGCCLRSRKMLLETARLATDARMRKRLNFNLLVDTFTCYDLHDELRASGLRFAPPEVAAAFSFEQPTEFSVDWSEAFGYHGKTHSPTEGLRREVLYWIDRTRWRQAGGKLRLIFNRYTVADSARQAELDTCWKELFANQNIDEIITVEGRPTFQELIDRGNDGAGENDITIILNSDCHLDATAANFGLCTAKDFWAITRHERGPRGWELWNVPYSQDGWAWRGKCKIKSANFLPGTMGCDSALAYHAFSSGYNIGNPSRSIRLCHHHSGESRTALTRLPGPYLYVQPHRLLVKPVWRIDLNPKMHKGPAVWRPK